MAVTWRIENSLAPYCFGLTCSDGQRMLLSTSVIAHGRRRPVLEVASTRSALHVRHRESDFQLNYNVCVEAFTIDGSAPNISRCL